MKSLHYTINDALGIHMRPAGMLVRVASAYKCEININSKDKIANAKSSLGIMKMNVKQGDEVIITFDGEDEDVAMQAMQEFLNKNL